MKAELRPGERLDDLQMLFCCLPLHTVHRAAKLLTLVQVPGSSQSC